MTRLVVVGAGPAGLSLAYLLAQQGHQVALVDASTNFSRQFRGDALMPCGLEALSHMGLSNLVAELPQRPLQDWSVWIEGRRLFRVSEPMGSLQPCRLVAQQQLLEALLERAPSYPPCSGTQARACRASCIPASHQIASAAYSWPMASAWRLISWWAAMAASRCCAAWRA